MSEHATKPELPDDPLYTDQEAARYLNVGRKTLAVWRCRERYLDVLTPTYIGTSVRYRKSVLDRFIDWRTTASIPLAHLRKNRSNANVRAEGK
jgi:hypothetical protein